jgi:hypothetical protein
MAVGTYSGQIVLSSSGATTTLTIPVVLTIVPVDQAFFGNLPGAVSFSLKTGNAGLTPHALQVFNGGPSTLNWTLLNSTADGGSWLTVSSTSGTAPSVVTVGVNVANLPGSGTVAGTFIGHLTFQAPSGNVTIPVSVAVGTNILSQVNALAFTRVFGGANPLPQTLTIASNGTSPGFEVDAYAATGGNWLAASLDGSSCCYSTPHTVTASIVASPTLAVGTYTAEIVITASNEATSVTIPVTLTVVAAGQPFIDNMGGAMSFSLKTGDLTIPSQDIQIRNGGSGSLTWTLSTSTSDTAPWLSASLASGTAPSYVTVQISVANLPNGGLVAGTFIGQLVFKSATGNVTVPVSVNVGDNILRQVPAIHFTKVFGGADPLPQVLHIASSGTSPGFEVDASTATGGNWLTVSLDGSSCCYSTPHAIVATVNPSPSLAAGTYTGQIVSTSGGGASSITIPVTLTIAPANVASFDNLPGALSFSLKTAGTSVPLQELNLRSAGTGTLDWTLLKSTSDGGNWLTVSATSGTAPSSVIVGVTVANLPNLGLVAGTFSGELVFRSASGTSITVPISVTVADNAFAQINSIAFTKVFGGANPLPQSVTIASFGSSPGFEVDSWKATGGDWFTVSLDGSSCCYSTPKVLTVTVTAGPNLAAGTYTGQIVMTSSGGTMAMTIPVTLTVAAANQPSIGDIPGAVSFFLTTGSGAPPTQNIQIRRAGGGNLNWTLVKQTSDNGDWLTVSSSAGTAPSTVTIGVNLANLPNLGLVAGTFTGEIVFKSANGNVSVPVSVTVGASVFAQPAPLLFSKSVGGANPLAQNLNVTATGASPGFEVDASTATGGNWLSVTLNGSSCCYSTPMVITASIVASPGLADGTYTGQIVITSSGATMAMTVPVTLIVGTGGGSTPYNQTARAALRHTDGSIRVTAYGSATLNSSDGVFASDPGVAEGWDGKFFATARDNSNAIWANVFDPNSQTWGTWSFQGGQVAGNPSLAITPSGTSWIAARDSSSAYWLRDYTPGGAAGSWIPLFGVFATDPVVTGCPDGSIFIVGKDNWNALWSGHYIPGSGFQGFVLGGGVVQGNPSVTCGSDNALYMVIRDNSNSNWIARVAGNLWSGWFNGGAVTSIDPRIARLGGSVAVVILDSTGSVYRSSFTEGPVNGWQSWTAVGGVLADIAPSAVGGELYFLGKTPGTDLWWWRQSGNQWTWIGNNGATAGSLAAAPR